MNSHHLPISPRRFEGGIHPKDGKELSVNGEIRSVPLLDKIESIVMSIGEFGRTHALSSSDAYVYLKKYKGLEYLDKYHVSLSCFPIESLVDDLSLVCRNNGGTLRCSRSIMDRIAM